MTLTNIQHCQLARPLHSLRPHNTNPYKDSNTTPLSQINFNCVLQSSSAQPVGVSRAQSLKSGSPCFQYHHDIGVISSIQCHEARHSSQLAVSSSHTQSPKNDELYAKPIHVSRSTQSLQHIYKQSS